MNLERLIALICDEFSLDESEVNGNTLLEGIVSDEFEMQELVSSIESEFEVELEVMPGDDWSIEELADAITEA